MPENIAWREHLIYQTAPELNKLCKPLFQHFNTTYFNFVRRFPDGSEGCLSTDPEWTEYFYKHKLYKKVLADIRARSKTLANNLKIYPWTQFHNSPVRQAQSEHFGVGIGISLVFERANYTDFFHFGTQNEYQEMNELYHNFAECMIQFAHYFYDQGAKLIELASKEDNRLHFPDRRIHKIDKPIPHLAKFDVDQFVQQTQPKRFMVYNIDGKEVFLSQKEMQCVNLLTRGKTAPEIGEALFISSRTVETHFRHVREKLGLPAGTHKADLISAIYQSGFDLHDLMPLDRT